MERMQSTWENLVEFNLSESGVHPLRLDEIVDGPGEVEALLARRLVYSQSNGTPELRDRIAALYPGAVDESRTIKPQIPLVGENGIPLHDEIRLELALDPVEAVKDA